MISLAWERILEMAQLELILDTDKNHLMIEATTGGAVPRFVTVHINSDKEIDALIEALHKAKNMFSANKIT